MYTYLVNVPCFRSNADAAPINRLWKESGIKDVPVVRAAAAAAAFFSISFSLFLLFVCIEMIEAFNLYVST